MSESGPDLARLALEVAREAATLVRQRAAGDVRVADTKSSATDVVTEADQACETLIRTRLLAARPEDSVVGEEGADQSGTSGVRWIVDPIDGTVNFLYGIPQYAVSIAAEAGGRMRAGVVLNVATGREFVAWRGSDQDGAAVTSTCDGQPVVVRDRVPLAERLVGTGFSYRAEVRRLQAEALVRLLPEVRDVRRLGACALDLCHVAAGELDAYVEEGVNLWDFAAAGLVAEGAGARVEQHVGVGGGTLLVCAPEHSFDDFRQAVLEAGYARE